MWERMCVSVHCERAPCGPCLRSPPQTSLCRVQSGARVSLLLVCQCRPVAPAGAGGQHVASDRRLVWSGPGRHFGNDRLLYGTRQVC